MKVVVVRIKAPYHGLKIRTKFEAKSNWNLNTSLNTSALGISLSGGNSL